MRRSLSLVVRRELENLVKDPDSSKSAMETLKSYVTELDLEAIPLFLEQVSKTTESGFTGEYIIFLYEVIAQVNGTKIVSQIDNIMSSIIKALASSAGSLALHQACSKVVSAIARHGMDPTTPEDEKRSIIHSVSKPLSNSLLGSQESLSSGAAMCLKDLVECGNWRFASSETVNEVCQRVVGSLQKHSQANSHMALVMALAKHNSLIVEAYARLLIHTAVSILNNGVVEQDSQKRLYAIHMLNTIMKCLDPRSIFSEVWLIVYEMEKFQADQMAYVSRAAVEALQTVRRICYEKSPKGDRDTSSVAGSSYTRRDNGKSISIRGSGGRSPLTATPELQNIDSFNGYDYFMESPVSINSTNESFQGSLYDNRRVNRKLWPTHENGGVDLSPEDEILSELIHARGSRANESDEFSFEHDDCTEDFKGFPQGSDAVGCLRSSNPSPQIFTTPKKFMRSLQELNDSVSERSEDHTGWHRSKPVRSPTFKPEKTLHCNGLSSKEYGDGRSSTDDEQFQSSTESVCSTAYIPTSTNPQIVSETLSAHVTKPRYIHAGRWTAKDLVLRTLMVLFAVLLFLLCIDDQETGKDMVPT